MKKLVSKIKKHFATLNFQDLYLVVFLLPLIINPWALSYYEPPKILFLTLFTSSAALFAAIQLIRKKLVFTYNRLVFLLLGLWFLSLVLSTVFSIAPQLSFFGSYQRLQGLFVQINYLLHFLVIYQLAQFPGFPEKVFKMFYFVGLSLSLLAIIQKFGISLVPSGLQQGFVGRVYATLGHPNFLGQFLLFPVYISLDYLIKGKKFRWLHLLSFLLLFLTLYFTGNRASMLGLLVSLPIFLFPNLTRYRSVKYLVIALIVLLGGVLIYLAASNFRSMESRLLLWQTAPVLASQKPVLGSGLETIPYVFPQHYNPQFTYFETANSIPDRLHNEILDTLVTQGIFGLLVYILAIFTTLYFSFKNHRYHHSMLLGAAFLSVLVADQFGFSMSANYLEIFTLLALIAALNLPHHHLNSSTWSPSGRIALAVLILILTGWNLVYPVELAWADHQFGKAVDQILAKQEVEAAKTMIAADKINPHQGYLFQLSAQIMMTLASKNPNKTFYLDTAHFLVDQGQLFYAEDYQYYLLKGKIAVLSGDAVQSQKYFVRAAELAPNLSQVYLEWSQSCVQLKDYACFAAQLEKYLQLIPDYWKKGRDLNRQSPEDHDKFRIFLKENPSFWNLVEALQMYYSISGNSVQSSYYQKILQ